MTAKLTKGENLTSDQIRQVKAAFVHRLTVENGYPEKNPTGARVEPITDAQWLKEYAFYFRKDGKLASRPNHCVPVYMAE